MQKTNKLEIIGFVLMVIAGLFWLSEKYYFIDELSSAYEWAMILLSFGLFVWAIGLMIKESKNRQLKENDKKIK